VVVEVERADILVVVVSIHLPVLEGGAALAALVAAGSGKVEGAVMANRLEVHWMHSKAA
jgi:hypothetical protein